MQDSTGDSTPNESLPPSPQNLPVDDAISASPTQKNIMSVAVTTIEGEGDGEGEGEGDGDEKENSKSGEDDAVKEKPLVEVCHKRKASTDIPPSIHDFPSELHSIPKSQRLNSSPPISPSTGQQLNDQINPQGGEVNEEVKGNKGLLIGGLLEGLDLNQPIEGIENDEEEEEVEVEPFVASKIDDDKIAVVEEIEVDVSGNNEGKAFSVVAEENEVEEPYAIEKIEAEPYVAAENSEEKPSDVEKSDQLVENNEVESPTVEKNEVEPDAMEKNEGEFSAVDKMEVKPYPTEKHEVMTSTTNKNEEDSSLTQKIDGSGDVKVMAFDLNELPPDEENED